MQVEFLLVVMKWSLLIRGMYIGAVHAGGEVMVEETFLF